DEEAQRRADEELSKALLASIEKVERIDRKIAELVARSAEAKGPSKKKLTEQINTERNHCFKVLKEMNLARAVIDRMIARQQELYEYLGNRSLEREHKLDVQQTRATCER